METWRALYVRSRSEKKVLEGLIDKGIHSYLPLRKTLKQWSDRKKWVYEPLLNGYVFANTSDRIRENILQTPGVVNFVRYNNADAIIRQSEIDVLKDIEQHRYEIALNPQPLEIGERGIVNQGPLKDYEVNVVEVSNDYITCTFGMESIKQNFSCRRGC